MEITESELAEWKRLAEEATPGEWVSTNDAVEWTPKQKSPWNDRGASVSVLDPRTDIVVIVGGVQDEQGGAVGVLRNTDAAFITASRTAVPRLIAEVKRLKHAAKSWEKEADINNDVAQQQQNRAERAEAENARLREALRNAEYEIELWKSTR